MRWRTITQTSGTGGIAVGQQAAVTVSVTFPGLAPGQPATVTLATTATPGTAGVLARAAATANPDGTAAVTLTARLPAAQTVVITATAPHKACQATLTPASAQPALTCHTH